MSDRRARAEAVLRAHGLDPEHVVAGALGDVAAHALLSASDGAAVADALAELGDASTAALLTRLLGEPLDRLHAKVLRRALHRLHERGVPVPAPPPAVGHVATAGDPTAREAWLSAVDGGGTRLAWLASPRSSSGALVLAAAELNEPAGLTDLRIADVSRKQLRIARRHLAESGVHLVAAPFEVVDALVVEGQQRRGEVDHRLDYVRARTRLTSAAALAPCEPSSPRVLGPSADEIDALVSGSAALLEQPEIARWWPQPAEAEPFLVEIGELDDSPIVLNPVQQEERLAAVLARAAQVLYPPPVVARRLVATAYVLAETGRAAAARTAIAVARALERNATARDVPLLTALTHQGLGRLAAGRAAQRRSERQGSLVVTPGEALKDRSPGRPGHIRS